MAKAKELAQEVKLAIGIPYRASGSNEEPIVVDVVKVRKFTLKDKIDVWGIAKNDMVNAAAEFLSRVVVEPEMTRKQAMNVTEADRDLIMGACYQFTLGDEVLWQTECQQRGCGKSQDIPIDLSVLEIRRDDAGIYNLEDGNMTYSFELDGVGKVVLRALTGKDLHKVISDPNNQNNELRSVYTLYSECLLKFGDEKPDDVVRKKYTLDFLNGLDMDVLNRLEAEVEKRRMGYEKNCAFKCISCGRENRFVVDMLLFFFRNPHMETNR